MTCKYFKSSFYTETSLNKEWQKLRFKYHPDKGGKASEFIAMNEEYEVLLKQIQNSPIQPQTPEESKKQENNYQYKNSTPYQKQGFHKNEFIKYNKSKTTKQVEPTFSIKKYFQNKIFYRIIFIGMSYLWFPAALHLDVPMYIVILFYSLPILFALYTRIHIFAWFINLMLSGFLIIKLDITFMFPYLNFWFFFLIFYRIIYSIITMPYRQAYTKEEWNELGRKFKDNFL